MENGTADQQPGTASDVASQPVPPPLTIQPGLQVRAELSRPRLQLTAPVGAVTALVLDQIDHDPGSVAALTCDHVLYNWDDAVEEETVVAFASPALPGIARRAGVASRRVFGPVEVQGQTFELDAALAILREDSPRDGEGYAFACYGVGSPIWINQDQVFERVYIFSSISNRLCTGRLTAIRDDEVRFVRNKGRRDQYDDPFIIEKELMIIELDQGCQLTAGDSGAGVYNWNHQLIGMMIGGKRTDGAMSVVAAIPIQPVLDALHVDLFLGLPVAEVEVRRYYSPGSDRHLYTATENEPLELFWQKERSLGYGSATQVPERAGELNATKPIYRYFNPKTQDHFYTDYWYERRNGVDDYRPEGIAFYGYRHDAADRVEISSYTTKTPLELQHFYTEAPGREPFDRVNIWEEGPPLCYLRKI